jgi:5-methyltetrahydropteroyltriglutamate--homocysteine methyltransferase
VNAFATEIVGSYYKPAWLVRRDHSFTTDDSFFRPEPDVVDEAKEAAVRLAIDDQERAGLDVVTDGEQTRQSFSAHFFSLGGIDTTRWQPRSLPQEARDLQTITLKATTDDRSLTQRGPTVVGPVEWQAPITLDDLRVALRYAHRPVKVTLVGPFTLATRLVDNFYGNFTRLVLALADALNREARALTDAGAAVVQFDDPEIHFRFSLARGVASEALDRAARGVTATTAVHVCYGYSLYIAEKRVNPLYPEVLDFLAQTSIDQISLEYEQPGHQPELLSHVGEKIAAVGFISSGAEEPESVDHIRQRARGAAAVIDPQRLKLSTDCGIWFLPRPSAFQKIANLASAAGTLRSEVAVHA